MIEVQCRISIIGVGAGPAGPDHFFDKLIVFISIKFINEVYTCALPVHLHV